MKMTRMKVSFIDKETMKAIDPNDVYVDVSPSGVLEAWRFDLEKEEDIELEIKLHGYEGEN